MSCCGQSRQGMRATGRASGSVHDARPPHDREQGTAPPAAWVEFEYLGERTLIVMGQATRQFYRFVGRGARLRADARDRVSLSMTPGLREMPH
jgi:hypothetical protein